MGFEPNTDSPGGPASGGPLRRAGDDAVLRAEAPGTAERDAPAPSPGISLAELVWAAQFGGSAKAAAERELVDRFKAHVRRLLTRTLGPGHDVDDPMQEVFFRVFQSLSKVRPPEALPGFVTSVAVNVAHETLRKRRRTRWLSFFAPEDLHGLEAASAYVEIPESLRDFYATVGKLSAQAQLCITLRYVEGMKLEEMAAALEVSLATAKRHLAAAEQDMAALLHVTAPIGATSLGERAK